MKSKAPQRLNSRQVLIEELERRCRANSRYSLRAFARALEISPSALSMVIKGERGLSRQLAYQVSKKLGLAPEATQFFVSSSQRRGRLKIDSTTFNQLSQDQFEVISEWYHFAILSLIETEDFKPEISWIASRLTISQAEARGAIKRLVRMKLLDTSSKRWTQIGTPIFVGNTESTVATRRFQKQVLEKGLHSLENDPFSNREFNSVTIAIDPKHVPFAREKIKQFLVNLMNQLEDKSSNKEVFHLSTQLYPVSKKFKN